MDVEFTDVQSFRRDAYNQEIFSGAKESEKLIIARRLLQSLIQAVRRSAERM